MRRFVLFTVLIAILAIAGAAMAGELSAPRGDGNDVLVPNSVFTAVTTFKAGNTPIALCDANGWGVRDAKWTNPENLKKAIIVKEAESWRAPGMRGSRFCVGQMDKTGKLVKRSDCDCLCVKIEEVLVLPEKGKMSNCIDYTDERGPVIFCP